VSIWLFIFANTASNALAPKECDHLLAFPHTTITESVGTAQHTNHTYACKFYKDDANNF